MTQNIIIQAVKAIFLDLIGEILYFPVWWYTQGLVSVVLRVLNSIKQTSHNLALPLMFKNLFKPMYGQYDRTGRLISLLMRFVLTFSRLIVFILMVIFYVCFIVFWAILPLLVVWGLINNFSSLWKQ